MKAHLLWDRFLSFWLPPERAVDDTDRNINAALRATYDLPDGRKATFALKGGQSVIVVTETETIVASRIPPWTGARERPGWLDWKGELPGPDRRELLDGAVRNLLARPRPHVILRTGRRPFTLREIVAGDGTGVVVNDPGKAVAVDSVRIARARRALETLGSAARAKAALKLVRRREMAEGDTAAIDNELRTVVRRSKIAPDAFFDALDLLDGVSPRELALAEPAR